MTIANDIINQRIPDFDRYLREGESLDDIDEYGFTPLIETAITRQPNIAEILLTRGVDVNKPDVTGRTALHWAIDNDDLPMCRLLLQHGANANAYTRAGISPLVYPILRHQTKLKHLLYQYNAKLDFALDFIYAKLLGHRFELTGDVDIVNAEETFIALDYEGFILEFTVAIIKDSLQRFTSSYSTRHLRQHFPLLQEVMEAFMIADQLLQMQRHISLSEEDKKRIGQLIQSPLLVLPAASRGHAMGFVRYHQWWAKIDRGENSKKEGSINIYRMTHPEAFDARFIEEFLYKKQSRHFFHERINDLLGLMSVAQIPMSTQIAGNCSWANIQATVLVAYALLQLHTLDDFSYEQAQSVYEDWLRWDQDRALDKCIQRFYNASPARKASLASMLAAVLFQACDHHNEQDLERAEKILAILTLPDYNYILKSYLDIYCVERLTYKGNNLLKLLDDCGINPNIGVTPIATGLPERERR